MSTPAPRKATWAFGQQPSANTTTCCSECPNQHCRHNLAEPTVTEESAPLLFRASIILVQPHSAALIPIPVDPWTAAALGCAEESLPHRQFPPVLRFWLFSASQRLRGEALGFPITRDVGDHGILGHPLPPPLFHATPPHPHPMSPHSHPRLEMAITPFHPTGM